MPTKEKHFALIVPGLGDHGERFYLYTHNWEKDHQVVPVIHLAGWKDIKKPYAQIMADLVKQIEYLKKGGNVVSLLGASAGGSLAFNAFLNYPELVKNVVNLSGRLTGGEETGFRSFESRAGAVPAFAESVRRFEYRMPHIPANLKPRMLITKGWFDELVPEETMKVEGLQSLRVPFVEHGVNIALSVLSASTGGDVLRFIKSRRSKQLFSLV